MTRGWGLENRIVNIILYGADRGEKMEMEEKWVMKASKVALH